MVGGVLGAEEVVVPWVSKPGDGLGNNAGCVGARDVLMGVADPEEARVVGAIDLVSLDGKVRYPTGMPRMESSMH